MEKERVAREAEEKERAERMKKIHEQFDDSKSQWEKDKTDIQNLVMKEKAAEKAAEENRTASKAAQSQGNPERSVAEKKKEDPKSAGGEAKKEDPKSAGAGKTTKKVSPFSSLSNGKH